MRVLGEGDKRPHTKIQLIDGGGGGGEGSSLQCFLHI